MLPPINGKSRLDGVWCRCGGEVWYENLHKIGQASRELAWEAYCRKCKACDANGYSSKAALLRESPAFWGKHGTIRIAEVRGGRAVFTGEVRCLPERLDIPLKRRKPTTWFVDSMSDLFHEAVPFEFVDRVFAVMALCPQHTFQILTKRPERMREYLSTPDRMDRSIWQAMVDRTEQEFCEDHEPHIWPLPNVWLGTSVEDQPRADERIPHLLACLAAVRFLSCEPLLGPVDLSPWLYHQRFVQRRDGTVLDRVTTVHPTVDWVIAGGESGPHARPCDVAWIRSIVDQCEAAGVACFVKQLGARPYDSHAASAVPGSRRPITSAALEIPEAADQACSVLERCCEAMTEIRRHVRDRKGGDPSEWPEDLRVRQMPKGGA